MSVTTFLRRSIILGLSLAALAGCGDRPAPSQTAPTVPAPGARADVSTRPQGVPLTMPPRAIATH